MVPRLWPGETIVCIGTGPSLTEADVVSVRGRARVIAINDAYRLAPWADVLLGSDSKWWKWQLRQRPSEIRSFSGLKFTMHAPQMRDVVRLKATGVDGLEQSPHGLRHGRCGGYQAINLAVLLGAARIVLLGYDMTGYGTKTHFFGHHADHSKPLYRICLRYFPTLVKPLKALGIEVVNCSRESAIECFLKRALADVFASTAVAA